MTKLVESGYQVAYRGLLKTDGKLYLTAEGQDDVLSVEVEDILEPLTGHFVELTIKVLVPDELGM